MFTGADSNTESTSQRYLKRRVTTCPRNSGCRPPSPSALPRRTRGTAAADHPPPSHDVLEEQRLSTAVAGSQFVGCLAASRLRRASCVLARRRHEQPVHAVTSVTSPGYMCYKVVIQFARERVFNIGEHFYRAMLCIRGTSHGPVSVCVRLSVCHKSEFY